MFIINKCAKRREKKTTKFCWKKNRMEKKKRTQIIIQTYAQRNFYAKLMCTPKDEVIKYDE